MCSEKLFVYVNKKEKVLFYLQMWGLSCSSFRGLLVKLQNETVNNEVSAFSLSVSFLTLGKVSVSSEISINCNLILFHSPRSVLFVLFLRASLLLFLPFPHSTKALCIFFSLSDYGRTRNHFWDVHCYLIYSLFWHVSIERKLSIVEGIKM